MRFRALVTDYDGTLAEDGEASENTLRILHELPRSGFKLVLATGRVLPELRATFPALGIFDRVVLENGAVLLEPASGRERVLADPPPPAFAARLRELGAGEVILGRVLVASFRPYQEAVAQAVRESNRELELIFNKNAVMVLPAGVDKATGVRAALAELGLTLRDAVAVGDAENDRTMLAEAGFAVAVANAVPALKADADWVTELPRGAGVAELAARLLAGELETLNHP